MSLEPVYAPLTDSSSASSLKRDWTRFPPDRPEAWVLAHGEKKRAAILDESYGGIGVLLEMADVANIHSGDAVIVLHHDYPTPGLVQWMQRDEGTQRVRVGIRWS